MLTYICTSILSDSSISLKVDTTTVEKSGDWVTVSWEGMSSPSKKDWIGVYSPPANNAYGINATKNSPIKYQVYITATRASRMTACLFNVPVQCQMNNRVFSLKIVYN